MDEAFDVPFNKWFLELYDCQSRALPPSQAGGAASMGEIGTVYGDDGLQG